MDQRDRFLALLDELRALADAKGHDYADPGAFINTEAATEWGLPPMVRPLLRLSEKYGRLRRILRRGVAVKADGVRDELLDIAVIALFLVVLTEERPGDLGYFRSGEAAP